MVTKTAPKTKAKKIKILYEDTHILAIDKPAGLVVHPDGKTDEPALTDWVLKNYPRTKNVGEPIVPTEGKGEPIARPGIVHRLDRETSGVLLIAKTAKGHAHLKAQFQDRTVGKKYLVFVYGLMKEKWGIIDRPIGRSSNDFRKWSSMRGTRGEMRPAETWWTLIHAGRDLDNTGAYSYMEVEPKTGRTHQIRVHFKAINHPVVCDKLYASEKPKALGFERTALHASSITFLNMKGEKTTVKADLPADFEFAIKELGVKG